MITLSRLRTVDIAPLLMGAVSAASMIELIVMFQQLHTHEPEMYQTYAL